MAEVIVNKKIVISAEDRATSVIARTNEAFNQLNSHLDKLESSFHGDTSSQASFRQALNETRATVRQAQTSFDQLNNIVNHLKSPHIKATADTRQAETNLHNTSSAADRTTKAFGRLRDFVGGTLIANGISAAAAATKNWAKQGFQAALAGQEAANRWRNLGMSRSEIDATSKAVRDLKENTGMSGQAVTSLVTRFYSMTGSATQARTLARGVGAITDQLRLGPKAADAFAGGLQRIESSGKVTTRSLGRLEKQAPGISSALQKASGLSKQSFDQLLASGKMTSDQFNQWMTNASKNYRNAARDWDGTTEGALKHMRQTWADNWQAMMKPLVQSSSFVLGALNKSMSALTPQFTALGKAISNVATEFARWLTPQHARDIGKIVGSLGRIAAVLARGVWKAVTAPLLIIGRVINSLTGKKGDALDAVATALEHISKNKVAMTVLETIGAILATQFAYNKLFKMAAGLGLVDKNLGMLGKIHFSGHMFDDLFKNLRGLKNRFGNAGSDSGKEFSTRMERDIAQGKTSGNVFDRIFKRASTSAAKSGDEAGGNFATRMMSKVHGANVEGAGRSIGSRMGGAMAIAFGAIDLFKALQTKKNRAENVGKSLGTTIGGMAGASIGATLGSALGPIGTLLGGLLGGAIGSKAGGEVGKAFGKLWPSIRKGASAVGKFLLNVLTAPFKAAIKAGEWLGEKIKDLTHHGSSDSLSKIKSLGGNHYSKQDIANIRQMNAAVRAYTSSLERLKSVTKKNDPTKQLRNMSKELKQLNPTLEKSAKYWRAMSKPVETTSKSFKTLDKSLQLFKGKNNPMDRLDKSVQRLTKTVKKEQFGKELAKQMEIADKSMSGKHSFVGRFQTMTRQVEKELRTFRITFNKDWRDIWERLEVYPNRGLSRALSIESSRLSEMRGRERSFTSGFLSTWRSWLSGVVSAMRSEFDKLPGIASNAMHGIVSRLNGGISAINQVISAFGGDKQLSQIHYARGTFAPHPGGKAVVNDGPEPDKTELIWQPSKGWGTAQGQYVVRDLEAGSMVMDAKHSAPILHGRPDLFPHYALGDMSTDEMLKIAEAFMNNPVKASTDLMLQHTNWSGAPIYGSFGKATAVGFARGIANVLKDMLSIIMEPVNGDWTPVILSAAHLLHFNIAGWQVAKLLRQIQTESGGRERVTNNWDSNAAAGHPSQGLLQFVPSTFYKWAVGRFTDINRGFDQILAAINCLNNGGEGGWGNIGNGHGWATGGHITSLDYGFVGDNPEHDEYIINPYNSQSLPLMNEAYAKMEANHPEWRSANDTAFKDEIVSLMKSAISSIQGIDLQPTVQVEDVSKHVSHYQAKEYALMKGGR